MQINYTTEAFTSLTGLVNFIEANNTKNAGLRWLGKFELFLQANLNSPNFIRLCNNLTFSKLNLHCVYFNDWVVAFSVHAEYVLIEAIMHKSRITD